jgi:hypothetical protein
MLWVCRPWESLAEHLQELSGFPGGFADFCGQVERELWDLSGFVAERVRTPVKAAQENSTFLSLVSYAMYARTLSRALDLCFGPNSRGLLAFCVMQRVRCSVVRGLSHDF